MIGKRAFRVDLTQVAAVDEAGRGLLARMRESGAELIAAGTPAKARDNMISRLFRNLQLLCACLLSRPFSTRREA